MRPLQAGLFVVCLALLRAEAGWADFALAVDCSLLPAKNAAGFLPAVLPIDVNGDGVPDPWLISNGFGNVVDCHDVPGIGCFLQHHTGVDYLVNGHSSDSQGREVHAVDNGIVVFSTNGQSNPRQARGGLILIKHVAPPENHFEIPAYSETLGKGSSLVTISYPREFTTEIVSYYLHLGDAYVKKGDSVSRGQVIGRTYTNAEKEREGYTFVPHLHLEIWRRCMANDSEGYAPFGGSFLSAARAQLVSPPATMEASRADRELVRMVPNRLPGSGGAQILGADFGDVQGWIQVTGQPLFSSAPQVWNLPVPMVNWSDREIRVSLFQGPLLSASYLTGPLFFEVRRSDGVQEGAFFYPFKDVKPNDWFAGSVTRLWKDGLVEGVSGLGRFLPDDPISRSEFVKLLVQAFCRSGCSQSGTPNYTDVHSGDWFFSYVSAAWGLGWLDHNQTQFRPHDSIARAEVVKMVALAANLALATPAQSPYSDVLPTDWFAPYVIALTETGALTGYTDGTFRPAIAITRAQAANIVERIRP